MAGRVAEAERLAQEAYDLGRRAQARDADTVHAAQLLVLRRREDRLQEYISTVESFVAENPTLVAWRALLPLAHMVAGDAEAGVAEFERLVADDCAAVPRDMFWFTVTAILAETCALLRDAERARFFYDRLLPYRERMVQITQAACLGSTERFLGLLAGSLGEWDAAVGHLEAGLERNAPRSGRSPCACAASWPRRCSPAAATATGRAPRSCCSARCRRPSWPGWRASRRSCARASPSLSKWRLRARARVWHKSPRGQTMDRRAAIAHVAAKARRLPAPRSPHAAAAPASVTLRWTAPKGAQAGQVPRAARRQGPRAHDAPLVRRPRRQARAHVPLHDRRRRPPRPPRRRPRAS